MSCPLVSCCLDKVKHRPAPFGDSTKHAYFHVPNFNLLPQSCLCPYALKFYELDYLYCCCQCQRSCFMTQCSCAYSVSSEFKEVPRLGSDSVYFINYSSIHFLKSNQYHYCQTDLAICLAAFSLNYLHATSKLIPLFF